ncbi:MAG: type II toxin-antitoxin system Phd/YefM family antitoxin [Verrucomicrobiia bacterium]|jgi:prevent-host-death family protein
MKTVNVHQAKTHLSALLVEVGKGEEIVIARNGTAVARLVAVDQDSSRIPGRFAGRIKIGESCFDPLSEDELGEFENGQPGDPLR